MNRYKLAETIVTKIVEDLKERIGSGAKWDVADEEIRQEITDKWEDIVLTELEASVPPPRQPSAAHL